MRTIFRQIHFIIFSVALLFTAGCASKSESPNKPQPVVVDGGVPTNAAASPLDKVLQQAAAQPSAPLEGAGWKSLYDGRTLKGWAVSDFGGHGAVHCDQGLIVADMGDALTGVNYTNGDVPKMNYEIALDTMKISGSDFSCGLTFPVGDTFCTLVLGGWGGGVVGISSIDGEDASENETSKSMRIETNRWYRVRVQVTEGKIRSWLDDQKIVDLDTTGRKIDLRFGEIESSKPLGIAAYQTTAAWREIKLRQLEGK